MSNYFFEKYRPEICRGLHKWCCEQILRHLRLFRAKKNFFKNLKFFDFFCISGVTDFLKNDQRLFWEIPTGNLSWTVQMVLRTNFKAFWVVSSEKKFSKVASFLTFFAYPGSQISWKMTNYFFERYLPEICCGLHKCCWERILRCFRSFWGIKKISKVASFLTFFAYPGSQISWKMTNYFFERYRPEICCGLRKWCCEQILRRFRLFGGKKFFFWKFAFFDFFAYPWSQISWKMTNFFFERYRPEICRGLHKWCCEQILRHLRLFRAQKNFSKIGNFLTFFACPGSQISWKMTNFFFERYRPEIFRGLHKWCCERNIRRFGSFRAKKKISKVASFLTFFAYPGSQISWKMTNYFFERYRPEICCGLHKWCCERILRCFRSFRGEKKFPRLPVFDFFAYPGSQISWKMTNFFFEGYRPEICLGLHKWCCEQILRHLRLFRGNQNFFKNWKFFDFFCISGLTDFLKNDQLLFERYRHEIWLWTAQMVLRKNFKAL